MAHIKRRVSELTGKTTYQVQIPQPGARRIVKTFAKRRDAERWLIDQQSALQRGDYIDNKTAAKPFRELVATWERTRAAKLAPKTRERYGSVTRTYLLPAFGSRPLGKLTRAEIKEWFAGLAAEGCSPGTVRKIQVVLSSILSEGVELGLLRENPATRLRLAAPARRDHLYLTAAQVRALAEAMPRPQDSLAVWMAAYAGLRAGELWALRRRDIRSGSLLVERTLTDAHGQLEFRNATKTDGSRRVVSLPTFLVNMIAAHLATLPSSPDALLFTAPGGANGRAEGDPANAIRHNLFIRRVFRPAVVGRPATKPRTVPSCSS